MRGRAMSDYREDQSRGVLGNCLSRRAAIGRAAGAGVALAGAAFLSRTSVAIGQEGTPVTDATPTASGTPTVVLVHGAFADASGWAGVIAELQSWNAVMAPANPLRGVAADAAYIASVVNQISGPVLLVGHSYGGVVITNAAVQDAKRRRSGLCLRLHSRTKAKVCAGAG